MQQEPLPTNAINTIVINDLVKNKCGEFISITLHQRLPEPAKGYKTLQPSVLPDGPPKRLPSNLPPPGTLRLTLSIKDLLGDGRCGTVYTTSLRCLDDPKDPLSISVPEPGLPFFPELFVKLADQARLEDKASEASLYDEMESLQGVAIPLCYGWFHAELGLGCTLLSSYMNTEHAVNSVQSKPTRIQLSVLLLEQMGDVLPLGEPIPDRSDLWAIFSDLSQLGIDQPDMRYSNILLSPSSNTSRPHSLPSKLCPYHHRIHNYRAIDIDRARKTDWTLKQHYYQQVGTLGRLMEMMEMNVIIEPWEY